MLLCPQCQFENPNANKFCQQCGTSLMYKACPQCGTQVAYNDRQCHNCGVVTGQVWLAVVSRGFNGLLSRPLTPDLTASELPPASEFQIAQTLTEEALSPTEVSEPDLPSQTNEGASPATKPLFPINFLEQNAIPASEFLKAGESESPTTADQAQSVTIPSSNPAQPLSLEAGTFLDSQQRYQLLEPLPAERPGETVTVPVLDCQPLQVSPLNALLLARDSTARLPPPSGNTEVKTEDWANTGLVQLALGIAQPYISLHSQFPQNFPTIHDAWQENGQTIVLLENSSDWPLLAQQLSDNPVSTQQILYWLHETTELWLTLEPWNCRQSLLELSNLRVNPNSKSAWVSLHLQRLYPDVSENPLELPALGQLWQTLFDQSQRTLFQSLAQLLRDLSQGQIYTLDELRLRLERTQMELEPEYPSTSTQTRLQAVAPGRIMDAADTTTLPLPMQIYRLEDAGRTDVGRQRNHNEDFFGIWTQINKLETCYGRALQIKGLYVLCDGMGGHASGEVASQLAVETLKQYFQAHWGNEMPTVEAIREAVLLANKAIYETNQKEARSGSGRMGTTLVMLLIQGTKAAVAHVGDSRLYRLRRGQSPEQITTDHEVGQREINRGVDPEIAYARPDAYQLTQALGPRDTNLIKPEVQFLELEEDTLLLLASDGLTDNNLLNTHWQTHLAPLLNPQTDLEEGVSELIHLANQYNGHDNITAILIRAQVRPCYF